MIPLKDNVPMRRFPVVCVLLIAINVVVFLIDRLGGHYVVVGRVLTPQGLMERVHYVPLLSDQYALVPANVVNHFSTAWPTIFTSLFLHANWLHIGGNMLYLWIFGNNVEDTLGRFRFVLFYFACGLAAGVAHIFSNPQSTVQTIGASGAIAGLMGAYLILFPRAQILTIVPIFFIGMLMEVPAILVIGFWALINFLNASFLGGGDMPQTGGVAYLAHLGGFAAGIILILLLGGRRLVQNREPDWRDRYIR